MVAVVVVFVRYVANPLTERLARAQELLVIFAIAMAAMFAAVGDLVGLGKEVGGLLAGIALASTPYRETIAARLAPLRDFLLLFFFIALGSALDLSLLGAHVTGAIVFSLFVLIGNPLIVLVIMGALGYRKRTGFLAGLTVAQISEFSLIFRRDGRVARPCRGGCAGPRDDGRPRDHRRVHLHDHLFAPALCAVRAGSRRVRAPGHPARAASRPARTAVTGPR